MRSGRRARLRTAGLRLYIVRHGDMIAESQSGSGVHLRSCPYPRVDAREVATGQTEAENEWRIHQATPGRGCCGVHSLGSGCLRSPPRPARTRTSRPSPVSMASSVTSTRVTPLPPSIGSVPPSTRCSVYRTAADDKRLEITLKELFGPLGPGIDIGARLPTRPAAGPTDPALITWRYLGPGIAGASRPGPVRRERGRICTQPANPTIQGFATLMQTVPANDLRGKTVRLRGKVRAAVRDGQGSAALWLRVDRADRAMGFFDNMGDRPIRDAAWRDYAIEGPVAADATNVAFGVMASGAVQADFDAINLEVRDASGGWTPLQIHDADLRECRSRGSPDGRRRARPPRRSPAPRSRRRKAVGSCACPGRPSRRQPPNCSPSPCRCWAPRLTWISDRG